MLEEKIQKKREELNESLEKHKNYEYIYKLSVELDDLIAEFYKESQEKKNSRKFLKGRGLKKILYIV